MAQRQPPPPHEDLVRTFGYVNKLVLDMAEDFPADKYGYRPKPEMRTFGEVIVHIMSGTAYAAKAGRGENAKWDEIDPKTYKGKEEIVAALKKNIDNATAALKEKPDEQFAKSLEPWLGVTEHSAEHYGLLVAYYRLNGLVPPASRPKSK
jgi:hypothetical protein